MWIKFDKELINSKNILRFSMATSERTCDLVCYFNNGERNLRETYSEMEFVENRLSDIQKELNEEK